MKSHRPRRTPAAQKQRIVNNNNKPRFAQVGNTALRQLYQADSEPYTPPAEELVIAMNERKYIQTLTESCCRWPIGDPQEAEFHFCGKKKVAGLPYCDVHARRAFQPPQARRRDHGMNGQLPIQPMKVPSDEKENA